MASNHSDESEVISWHSIQANEALELMGSSLKNGLSKHEVLSRQKKYGFNELPQKKTPPFSYFSLDNSKAP